MKMTNLEEATDKLNDQIANYDVTIYLNCLNHKIQIKSHTIGIGSETKMLSL